MRLAHYRDISKIVILVREFREATGQNLPFNEVYLSSQIAFWIENQDAFVCVNDKCSGVIIATLSDYPFAPIRQSMEVIWYVKPSARGKDGLLLLNSYINWAESKDCTIILAMDYLGLASKIYKRRGFRLVDNVWARGV